MNSRNKSLFQTKRHSWLGMKWALIQSSQVELVPLKQWLHILQSEPSKTKEIRKTSLLFKPTLGSPGGTVVNNLPSNAGYTRDTGSIPGLGRSPGVGNGNPLQYSCLENSMDRGVWQATFYGVANKGTQLSMHMGACMHTHTHSHSLHPYWSVSLLWSSEWKAVQFQFRATMFPCNDAMWMIQT